MTPTIAARLAAALTGLLLAAAPALAQQSPSPKPLGALANSIEISGQIAGGERRHAYKFTIAERSCVRLDRVRTSVSLRAFLYDDRRGLIQKRRWDDPNRISRYVTQTMEQTLFPGDYVLEVELFYSRDTAAVYDLVIARC
jgi:hypothetical protein